MWMWFSECTAAKHDMWLPNCKRVKVPVWASEGLSYTKHYTPSRVRVAASFIFRLSCSRTFICFGSIWRLKPCHHPCHDCGAQLSASIEDGLCPFWERVGWHPVARPGFHWPVAISTLRENAPPSTQLAHCYQEHASEFTGRTMCALHYLSFTRYNMMRSQ